jgi:hypothetical protein
MRFTSDVRGQKASLRARASSGTGGEGVCGGQPPDLSSSSAFFTFSPDPAAAAEPSA